MHNTLLIKSQNTSEQGAIYCIYYEQDARIKKRLHCYTEAEFLDVIRTKILRLFLHAIHSHLYKQILLPTFGFLGLEI